MFLRMIAILFGIGFIFAGVAGFLPQFTQNGLLFTLFEVSTMHNLADLVIGVIAIMAATSYYHSRLFFQVLGLVFAVVAIAGFALQGDLGFMKMHFNMADNILNIIIAAIALYLGFALTKAEDRRFRG